MAYIYKITNLLNNKIYIGKTMSTPEDRFSQHIRDSKKTGINNRPLYKAINKYGIENFSLETIEECDFSIVNEREKYWIEYYNSYHYGYNATMGGDGKQYYDYTQIYILWKEGYNSQQIKDKIGCSDDTITIALRQFNVSTKERQIRANEENARKVAMLNYNTESIIQIFPSLSEAARFVKKPEGKGHISAVCKGKRKSAYGYKWKFI
jgi:group I intron endonuclease